MSSHHRLHHSHSRVPPPLPPTDVPRRIIALEDRIAAQYSDLQKLLSDNQRLAATHVALKQDLAASRQELRLLADSAVRAKADADAEIRALHEGAARAEEDARRMEAMREQLVIVRLDVTRLVKERNEMAEMTRGLKAEVEKARADVGRVSEAKREIDFMRNEIDRGRYIHVIIYVEIFY